jgi:hypothetical protein
MLLQQPRNRNGFWFYPKIIKIKSNYDNYTEDKRRAFMNETRESGWGLPRK